MAESGFAPAAPPAAPPAGFAAPPPRPPSKPARGFAAAAGAAAVQQCQLGSFGCSLILSMYTSTCCWGSGCFSTAEVAE